MSSTKLRNVVLLEHNIKAPSNYGKRRNLHDDSGVESSTSDRDTVHEDDKIHRKQDPDIQAYHIRMVQEALSEDFEHIKRLRAIIAKLTYDLSESNKENRVLKREKSELLKEKGDLLAVVEELISNPSHEENPLESSTATAAAAEGEERTSRASHIQKQTDFLKLLPTLTSTLTSTNTATSGSDGIEIIAPATFHDKQPSADSLSKAPGLASDTPLQSFDLVRRYSEQTLARNTEARKESSGLISLSEQARDAYPGNNDDGPWMKNQGIIRRPHRISSLFAGFENISSDETEDFADSNISDNEFKTALSAPKYSRPTAKRASTAPTSVPEHVKLSERSKPILFLGGGRQINSYEANAEYRTAKVQPLPRAPIKSVIRQLDKPLTLITNNKPNPMRRAALISSGVAAHQAPSTGPTKLFREESLPTSEKISCSMSQIAKGSSSSGESRGVDGSQLFAPAFRKSGLVERPPACNDGPSQIRGPVDLRSLERKLDSLYISLPLPIDNQDANSLPENLPNLNSNQSEISSISSELQMDSVEEHSVSDSSCQTMQSDNTQVSQPELSITPEAILSLAKNLFVNRLMEQFWYVLDQKYSNTARTCAPSSTDQKAAGSAPSRASVSIYQKRKRQRNSDQDQQTDDDEAMGDGMGDRDSQLIDDPVRPQLKFACPYRKHDPKKYNPNDWRVCATTCYENITRLKQHIRRVHKVIQCRRCKLIVDNEKQLNAHQEAPEGCKHSTEDLAYWIKEKVEERLNSEKKTNLLQTNKHRWEVIYRILFPKGDIPSPYFVSVVEGVSDPGFPGFQKYAERELSRVVQEALEKLVDSEFAAIQERLQVRIGGVIEQCLKSLFSEYRASVRPGPDMGDNFASSLIEQREQEFGDMAIFKMPEKWRNPQYREYLAPEQYPQASPSQAETDPQASSSSDNGLARSCSVYESQERTKSNETSISDLHPHELSSSVPDSSTQAELWKNHMSDDSALLQIGSQGYQSFPESLESFGFDLSSVDLTQSLGPDVLLGSGTMGADVGNDLDFDFFLQQDLAEAWVVDSIGQRQRKA